MHFPQIRFVIPHFGGGFLRETLMLCDLCPNVYLDTSSSNRWMLYEPSGLELRDVFRRAIDVIGSKRLLFGSDSSYFPRGWNPSILEQQTKALYELGLDADEARLILHDNFIDLLVRRTGQALIAQQFAQIRNPKIRLPSREVLSLPVSVCYGAGFHTCPSRRLHVGG